MADFADFWAALGEAVGRRVADEGRRNGRKLGALAEAAREYLPPELRQQFDGAAALVTLGFLPGDEPTRAEIDAAFRRIARECHPDRHPDNPDAAARYKAAAHARDVLVAQESP